MPPIHGPMTWPNRRRQEGCFRWHLGEQLQTELRPRNISPPFTLLFDKPLTTERLKRDTADHARKRVVLKKLHLRRDQPDTISGLEKPAHEGDCPHQQPRRR